MRKFALIMALCASFLLAENDLERALKSPPQTQNAEFQPTNSALSGDIKSENSALNGEFQSQNSKTPQNSAQSQTKPTNSTLEQDEPNIYDFAKIAEQDYRGESQTLNILRIKPHDTNYFLPFAYTFKGRPSNAKYKRAETKFQFSVKKALFEDIIFLNETWYFGYTQTAWWQILAESAPFRELNYAPEAFISFPFSGFGLLKTMNLGFMHQSNGRDGAESRSWNRVYINALLHAGRFVFMPRAWYIVPEPSLSENEDIRHYLGNFDMKIAYLGRDTFAYILLRNNLNFKRNKGAIELNAGFDLFDNGVFWYVQYFNGYGESLIDYNRFMHKLGVGFLVAY